MTSSFYQISEKSGINIISILRGDITMEESEKLSREHAALVNAGKKDFILDLSEADFICTIVIACMIVMYKGSKDSGGRLVVCGAKNGVKKVLEMIKLDKVFEIHGTKQDAIRKMTQ